LYRTAFKRVVDVLLSVAVLVVALPLMIAAGIAIVLEDRGPALFRQMRVGKAGKEYRLYKLRSMPVHSVSVPSKHAQGLRTTRVGRIIRRTNIDELPQLFNILRGDMSVVGPRPALSSQTELIALRRANGAYDCKPGLTGLAQVNSYDGMPETEKADWDGRYAATISFASDCRILLRTVVYLGRRPPVY
jgi:O-antigen biosynthesis protein WbqP